MNKINLFLLVSFLLAIVATGWYYYQTNNRVGDIAFNSELDNPSFNLCNDGYIGQDYASYGANYYGGKKAIKKHIFKYLQHQDLFRGSGLITFRFVVNCKGETGYYRVKSIDEDLQETEFDPQQLQKLEAAIAQLEDWQPGKWQDEKFDSYYQITFKIENGKITDIF